MTKPVRETPVEAGARVAELRKLRGLKQDDLVSVLGVADKAQVSRLEAGERRITIKELRSLADFFAVPLDALIYPDLFSVSYRTDVQDAENTSDMQWFRDFRRRYRLFVKTAHAQK